MPTARAAAVLDHEGLSQHRKLARECACRDVAGCAGREGNDDLTGFAMVARLP